MAKSPRPWTVTPHDPIRELEFNLWDVEGDVPGMKLMRRRMTIARRSDGRLVFFNAVPLDDAAMKKVEAFGEPGYLVVPNGGHRLDLHAFKARYPKLLVLTAPNSAAKVSQIVPVDGPLSAMPSDIDVSLEELGGSKSGEAVMTVRSAGRTTLVFADAFFNITPRQGVMGSLLKLTGLAGEPRVTPVYRLFFMKDAKAYAEHMTKLAETKGLTRLIVTHGNIVDVKPAELLRKVASTA